MNINPELLLKEILASEEKVKSLVGKDVVMVMGKTGTGKSTLINFLQGRKLKRVYNEVLGRETVELDDNSEMHSPKIGHETRSETAQPEAYAGSHNNREVYFCDTPGLEDTRTEEKKLSVPVANYLAAQYASSVLACMWVAEAETIRGAKQGELSSILERVKNVVAAEKMGSVLSNNTIFYFTKPALLPDGTKYTKEQLQARLPIFSREIADNEIKAVVDTMIAQPNRIFLSDFVNTAGNMDVASRDATYQAVTAMANTKIEKSAFKVSLSREQSAQVIAALLAPAHTYLEKYKDYQRATAVIEQAQTAIKVAQDRVTALNAENTRYEKEGLDLKDLINSKKANVEKQQREVDAQDSIVKKENNVVNTKRTAFNESAAAVDACKPVKSSGDKKGWFSSSSWTREEYPTEYKQLQLDKAGAKSALEIAQDKAEAAQQELALKRQNLRDAQQQLAEFETGRATGSVEAKQIIDRNKAEMATRQQEITALQNKVTTQKQVRGTIKGELRAKKSLYDQLVRISEFFLIEESAGQAACAIVSEFVTAHKQATDIFGAQEGATNSNAPESRGPR